MRSYDSAVKQESWSKSALIRLSRSFHSDCSKFVFASSNAGLSISTASIFASERCASIKAINPVPVPISRILGASLTGVQAPSKTPSVPTFIADFCCTILKCLNSNQLFLVITISLKDGLTVSETESHPVS